jgi:type IV secretory pathway TrbD component
MVRFVRPNRSDTDELELPRAEPLGVPPTVYHAEPRAFGLLSPALLAAAAAACFVLAIVLFALGSWAGATLLIGLTAVAGAFFVVAATRDPRSRTARASAELRGFVALAGTSACAWSRAGREVLRLRVDRLRLHTALRGRLLELGEAVHRDDAVRAEQLKAETRAIEAALAECDRLLAAAVARARGEVGDERLSAQRTRVLPRR